MLTAQVENYMDCEPELKAIYPLHWAELNTAPDIPLSPNYDAYHALYAAGAVVLVTLRDGPILAGYFLGFLMPGLHYQNCLDCNGDIFFVLPEYRKGSAGTKLFRAVEVALRERGVNRWRVASKIKNDSSVLLRRIGFTAIETLYSKRLV